MAHLFQKQQVQVLIVFIGLLLTLTVVFLVRALAPLLLFLFFLLVFLPFFLGLLNLRKEQFRECRKLEFGNLSTFIQTLDKFHDNLRMPSAASS